jgi:hypothetical protein
MRANFAGKRCADDAERRQFGINAHTTARQIEPVRWCSMLAHSSMFPVFVS